MDIYLLERGWDYEGSDIISIHETLEGAREAAKKLLSNNHEEIEPNRWEVGSEYIKIVKRSLEP